MTAHIFNLFCVSTASPLGSLSSHQYVWRGWHQWRWACRDQTVLFLFSSLQQGLTLSVYCPLLFHSLSSPSLCHFTLFLFIYFFIVSIWVLFVSWRLEIIWQALIRKKKRVLDTMRTVQKAGLGGWTEVSYLEFRKSYWAVVTVTTFLLIPLLVFILNHSEVHVPLMLLALRFYRCMFNDEDSLSSLFNLAHPLLLWPCFF